MWTITFHIIISFDIHHFIGAGYHINRGIVISSIAQNDKPSMYSL